MGGEAGWANLARVNARELKTPPMKFKSLSVYLETHPMKVKNSSYEIKDSSNETQRCFL